MNYLSKIAALFVIMVGLVALWINCSDNADTVISSSGNQDLTVSDYFPLTGNYIIYFQIENNVIGDTITYRFGLGGARSNGSRTVYPWSYTNIDYPIQTDTGYLYIDGNALYYYDNRNSTPEKILQGPFEVGQSWLRFETSIIPNDGDDGQGDWYYDNENAKDYGGGEDTTWYNKYDPDYDGGGAAKTFPVEGSNTCYITAIEDIELNNGLGFKNCLRVQNYNNGWNNYYWYAPGYGLVKYQIGVGLAAGDGGHVVGEFMQKLD